MYRFWKMSRKIEGPSYWDLATVHSKELLGDDTIGYMCKLCVDYGYRPWGLFTTTLDYLLVVSDPETIQEVFRNPHMGDKSIVLYSALSDYVAKGSLVLNGPLWKWHRKNVNPAFRKSNMDSRHDIMCDGAEDVVNMFREKADGPSFDITDIVDMGTVVMSLRFITSDIPIVPDVRKFYESIEHGMSMVQSKTLNPMHHWFKLKFDKQTRDMDKRARELITDSTPLIRQAKIIAKNRMSDRVDSQPVDVIECLASVTPEPELHIDEQDIIDEVLTIAVGAMETTRSTIKTMMMLLALFPDIQQRVCEEIERVLGKNDRPTPQDLQDMKYMEAVIKETLRLYPSIPIIGRQVNKTSTINGVVIPRGTCIIMNLMAMHRNPKLFHDPLKFVPERFLAEGQEKRHPYAFIPFGAGPRICVGYAQAMITVKTLMTAVLRNFQIVPGENIKSMDDLKFKMSVSIYISEPMVKLISRGKPSS